MCRTVFQRMFQTTLKKRLVFSSAVPGTCLSGLKGSQGEACPLVLAQIPGRTLPVTGGRIYSQTRTFYGRRSSRVWAGPAVKTCFILQGGPHGIAPPGG